MKQQPPQSLPDLAQMFVKRAQRDVKAGRGAKLNAHIAGLLLRASEGAATLGHELRQAHADIESWQARAERLQGVVDGLRDDLTELGFGKHEDISGDDLIDAINNHFPNLFEPENKPGIHAVMGDPNG